LKCDSTRTETRFRLSAKRTSPFKSLGALVQSTTVSRGTCMCISGSNGSNAGYTIFQGSVKSTVYLLHSPVSPSLPLPCVTVCHHISTGVYWGKRPGLEDDRPTSFSAKIKHEWICTSAAPYGFVTFTGTTLSYSHLDFWSRRWNSWTWNTVVA